MRENCTSGSMRGSGRPTLHAASLPLSTLPSLARDSQRRFQDKSFRSILGRV